MDKLKMQTANKTDENFRKLAAIFPNAVTETITGYDANGKAIVDRAIDKDVLMQEISCTVVDGNEERYQFTWPDKKKSVLLANAPINKTLRPVRDDETDPTGADSEGKPYCSSGSVNFDTTENLYIEGDNLEVLKLLQETYLGKIKMIYIDPPYNTGNDFVYEDDFAQSADEYLANSGQFDEDGNRMVQNTESNGRFHTDWLNMIYPRLKLAKDLLTEDGVIFISIDDNEQGNLRKICNQVFGEQNFIAQLIWEKKFAPQNDDKYITAVHDYILTYAKHKESWSPKLQERTEEALQKFKNPDNDHRGAWTSGDLTSKTKAKGHSYVDMKRKVTDKYRQDVKYGIVAELPEELKPMADGIHTLIQAVYDDSILKDMFSDGHETKVKENPLNENFAKREFQALWREINHKYAYTVDFDSAELIRNAIAHIDEKLFVSELQYTTTIGRQKTEMNEYEIERGASFTGEKTRTQTLKHAETKQIKYDLIGKIAEGTVLTRRTASAILQGIRADKLYMFKNNPEEFITKVIRLINEQKATMIVEHISYDTIEGEYDSSIFTAEKATQSFDRAFLARKAIQDYVFTDGLADKSVERKFAEDLDAADEVCVYAKLPRTFQIPTPVGNYSPDWAIAFYEGTVKHIFFIAETKGTMESLELRPIEQAKISCAKKLFNEMSTSNVVYHDVDSYQNLLNIMNSI